MFVYFYYCKLCNIDFNCYLYILPKHFAQRQNSFLQNLFIDYHKH